MSISFYPYVLEQREDGQVWSWPEAAAGRMKPENIPSYGTPEYWAWYDGDPAVEAACRNPNYDPRLNVNLAERNAKFVLNELGMLTADAYDAPPVPIDVFEAGLQATISRNPEPIPGLDGYESHTPGGSHVISGGTPDGYANRCFERLLALVEAAREYGATHVGWG